MKTATAAMIMLSCLVLGAAGQQSPCVNVVDGVVYVTGVQKSLGVINGEELTGSDVFSVYTDEAFIRKLKQAVGGTYALTSDGLSFKPLYPFAPGQTYHVVFSKHAPGEEAEGKDHEQTQYEFRIPASDVPVTSIQGIYPESNELPENTLRMYISFSAPMMPGEAYKHIRLLDSEGQPIRKAFLIIDQELWDASRTRLTVLFDPGRIKRGLRSNLEMGAPLKEGGEYTLKIDPAWRDVNGRSLATGLARKFRVVAPNRGRLSVDTWKVIPPEVKSRSPLVVRFDRPMDHALIFKYVTVQDEFETVVTGRMELKNDNVLTYTPDVPWHAGRYNVIISPLLEDVAGNNFRKAFDVDLEQDSRVAINTDISLPFVIVSSPK